MSERIPVGVAKLVVFRAFLVDGKTPATGKTIAITLSKNGATSFSNPAAGATNATEMASGFYKFTLATGDIDTQGPLAWRGAHADINDAGDAYSVVNAHNAGFDALPNAAAEAAGGLFTRGTGAGQINQANNGQIDANAARTGGTTNTGRDIGASVLLSPGTGTGQLSLSSGAVLLQATQTGVTIPTVTTVTNAPSDSSGVTTLLSRLSTTRAGYLDNLSAGAVALESSLQALITTIGASAAGVATAVWSAVTRTLTAGTNIVLAKGTGVTGFNDLSAAQVNAEADTAIADAGLATAANLATVAGYIDTEVAAIMVVTAKVNSTLESDGGSGYRFTTTALENAPAGEGGGGTGLTAAQTRAALGLAAADLDAQLATLATAAALSTAASNISAVKAKTDNLPVSPAAVGSAMTLTTGERTAVANEVEAQIIDETDSEKVLVAITDKIAAINPSLSGLTLSAIAAAVRDVLNTSPASNSLGAMVKASADRMPGSGTLPTTSDLTTALAAADDATLAAITGLGIPALSTLVTAVKAKTDAMVISGGKVDANVESINGVDLKGAGVLGNKFGPV